MTDVRIIKTQLGHTNVATTFRYVHTDAARAIEAVETIPTITERKLAKIKPDAENKDKPPSPNAVTDRPTDKSAS
jgi:hypothetical protein